MTRCLLLCALCTLAASSWGASTYCATLSTDRETVDQPIVSSNDLVLGANGDVFLAGTCVVLSNYVQRAWSGRYNLDGNVVWSSMLTGPSNSNTWFSAATDAGGNLYASGIATNNSHDLLVAKYDPSGNKLWEFLHDGRRHIDDYGYIVRVDAQGNTYVAGIVRNLLLVDSGILLKLDPNGALLWLTYFGTASGNAKITDMAFAANGQIAICGSYDGIFAVGKYSPTGQQLWLNFTNSYRGAAQALDVDSDGSIVAAGTTDVGNRRVITARYNPAGVREWVQFVSGNGNFEAGDIKIGENHSAYVSFKGANGHETMVKYALNGAPLWESENTVGCQPAPLHSVDITSAGEIVSAGGLVTARNPQGQILWKTGRPNFGAIQVVRNAAGDLVANGDHNIFSRYLFERFVRAESPSRMTVLSGGLTLGGVAEIRDYDLNKVSIFRKETKNRPGAVKAEFEFQSPVVNLSHLTIAFDVASLNLRLNGDVRLFDFVDGVYKTIRVYETTAGSRQIQSKIENPNRYCQAGTGRILALLEWEQAFPQQDWGVELDQVAVIAR